MTNVQSNYIGRVSDIQYVKSIEKSGNNTETACVDMGLTYDTKGDFFKSAKFEKKDADAYVKGKLEIQNEINKLYNQKREEIEKKYPGARWFVDPVNISEDEIKKIETDYKKNHPEYAEVEKKANDIIKKKEKIMELKKQKFIDKECPVKEDEDISVKKYRKKIVDAYMELADAEYAQENDEYKLLKEANERIGDIPVNNNSIKNFFDGLLSKIYE